MGCLIDIVGCGPAGDSTLRAQLSKFGRISTCIVEQKDDRLLEVKADWGIAASTMEMLKL